MSKLIRRTPRYNETKIRSCGSKKLEINRDTDTRELMRPRPGPSDLRYSNLQPNKELREVMKPKPLSCTENKGTSATRTHTTHPPKKVRSNLLRTNCLLRTN